MNLTDILILFVGIFVLVLFLCLIGLKDRSLQEPWV
jgi:hypothetical protein